MAILEKTIRVFKCDYCGYEWQRRKRSSRGKPRICPECKNPRWNKSPESQKVQVEPLMIESKPLALNQ